MLIITVKPPSLLAPFPLLKMNWKELSLHSSNLQATLAITDNTFSGVGDLVISFSLLLPSLDTHEPIRKFQFSVPLTPLISFILYQRTPLQASLFTVALALEAGSLHQACQSSSNTLPALCIRSLFKHLWFTKAIYLHSYSALPSPII